MHGTNKNLENPRNFWKVLEHLNIFQNVSKSSKKFQIVLDGSRRFLSLPKGFITLFLGSILFKNVLEVSRSFLKILESF